MTFRSSLSILMLCLSVGGCGTKMMPSLPMGPEVPIIDDRNNPLVEIVTDKGTIMVELFEDDATNAVNYFIYLLERAPHIYQNRAIYRADEIGIEAGPRAANASFRVKREVPQHGHAKYSLAIEGVEGDWLGLDILITRIDAFDLDNRNSVIGRVLTGKSVVDSLEVGDKILRIYIKRRRGHDYVPIAYGAPMTRPPARRRR